MLLAFEKNSFEVQALWKRQRELMTAPASFSDHAPAAVVPPIDRTERGASKPVELTKKQRRARLQKLRASVTVTEAEGLVRDIMDDWKGVGLHVFEAIGILSAFPDKTHQATDMIFLTLQKMFATWSCGDNPRKIWHEIKGSHGRAARYLKIADHTLVKILMRNFAKILK